ncbi:hypothetical protein HII28_02295 [Planctomonas sp. JC2975]|uniref:hypothetical protein n=1 Tax=Planctomonas sp. JC2975 TaxID=2729626 RepID=UPI001473B11E|nr:hypothetical protein [Planctomonas sp. JC2975]NNC10718.1 hypothetical protein [Planctomonas sp. JC2975]
MQISSLKGISASLAVISATVLLLSGCASPVASADPTTLQTAQHSGPTASQTAQHSGQTAKPTSTVPVADAIIVDASSLRVHATDGSSLGDYAYSGSPKDAINELTTLLGDPVVASDAPEKCGGGWTTYQWPALELTEYTDKTMWPNGGYSVFSRVSSAPIALTTPNGARIGSDWASYFAGVSGHPHDSGDYEGHWDRVLDTAQTADPSLGVIVRATNGAIDSIVAPSSLNADC